MRVNTVIDCGGGGPNSQNNCGGGGGGGEIILNSSISFNTNDNGVWFLF